MQKAVREAASGKPKKVILNLRGVNYSDSTGLSGLVHSYTQTQNMGVKLGLMSLDNKVRHLLVVTGLIAVFEIYKDEESALADC